MVKGKSTSKSAGKGAMMQGKMKKKKPPVGGLDAGAMTYMRMLKSPFSAIMINPLYGGITNGTMIRVVQEVLIGATTNCVQGGIIWIPGNAGKSTYAAESVAGQGLTFTEYGNGGPDTDTGVVNYGDLRCCAASMEVSWLGTELNRCGFLAAGATSGGNVANMLANNGLPAISYANAAPYTIRIPDKSVSFAWRPSDGDVLYNDPQIKPTFSTQLSNSRGAMMLVVQGMTPGVGVRVRLVAVYECLPSYQQGISGMPGTTNPSRNTMADVMKELDKTDWMHPRTVEY